MSEFYIIDGSGFIDYLGKFESHQKAEDHIEKEGIECNWLYTAEYLEDFLDFGKEILNKEKR